jgi:hypothetical protein
VLAAGWQDATFKKKQRQHGRWRCFFLYSPQLRLWAVPSPFEPLMKGLRPEPVLDFSRKLHFVLIAELPCGFFGFLGGCAK